MGDDISAHLEVKRKSLDPWAYVKYIDIPRNYQLFASICGKRLRDDDLIIPLSSPRGFPLDITNQLQKIIMNDPNKVCCHWITKEEIKKLKFNYPESFKNVNDITISSSHDLRIVCWWDQ